MARRAMKWLGRPLKHFLRLSGYELRRIHEPSNTNPPTSVAPLLDSSAAKVLERLNEPLVKVHVGCGPRVLKGWINIDLHFEPFEAYMKYYTEEFYPVELRGTEHDFLPLNAAEEAWPFPDASVDTIFHEDFIEHLSQKQQIAFLAESCRVLKPGGVHRVNTPNLAVSMSLNSEFSRGIGGVFYEEWDRHQHINVLTPNLLVELAQMVGYGTVEFTGRDESRAKGLPLEYRPDPNDRPPNGNLFADLKKTDT